MAELRDIIDRDPRPRPWAEGEKIPWDAPDFSRRMLREHLSQEHDAASRRFETIDRHVDWIHRRVLDGTHSRILDLGCGPGLYSSRLARLGHACHGIDFSPASVEYARAQASEGCTYTFGDLLTTGFGEGYDLAMFIYGELNAFRRENALLILQKARAALRAGGRLLLEVSTLEFLRQLGSRPAAWSAGKSGLFSDLPHLVLQEAFWEEREAVATERWFVVEAASGQVTRYAASLQAYTDDAYRALLEEAGYRNPEFHPSLAGEGAGSGDFFAILAEKG